MALLNLRGLVGSLTLTPRAPVRGQLQRTLGWAWPGPGSRGCRPDLPVFCSLPHMSLRSLELPGTPVPRVCVCVWRGGGPPLVT